MAENKNNQDWIWDRYWHFDRVASCFDTKGSNYPEEFSHQWGGFFTALPMAANILDLCTGNGAIARIAAAYSRDHSKNFAITGADRAAIDPGKFVSEAAGAIKFTGGAAAITVKKRIESRPWLFGAKRPRQRTGRFEFFDQRC